MDVNISRSHPNCSEKYENLTTDYFGPAQTGIFGAWLVLIIVLSITGNLMVITVILRSKRMREAKNGTNLFLFNLAISDLMVGICMAPVSLNTLIHEEWQFSQWFCNVNSFLNTLFLFASTHTLMYMSIHKFVSIRRHAKADPNPISRKVCLAMISAAWLWGALFGLITVFGLSRAVYRPKKLQCGPMYPKFNVRDATLFFANVIFNILTPIIIMAITYRKIFHILHKSSLFRAKSCVGAGDVGRAETGATKTLILVLTMFVLCWLPYVVYIHYALLIKDKKDIPSYLNPLAYCSGFTNSICNPVIYAFRFKDFQIGYRKLFNRTSYTASKGKRENMAVANYRYSNTSNSDNRTIMTQISNNSNRS